MSSKASAIEICRTQPFATEEELLRDYPPVLVEKVLRVREMTNWRLENPQKTDGEFITELMDRFRVSRVTAHSDLAVVRAMLPLLTETSRSYYRWRYNEMIEETYEMARKKGNVAVMERAATSMARNNHIDEPDELENMQEIYDKIIPQRFAPTDDPRVIGIEPIANINEKIKAMLDKYRAETIDIDDVKFEPEDVEFEDIFNVDNDPATT